MLDIKISFDDLSEQKQNQVRYLLRGEATIEWCEKNKKDLSDFYEAELTKEEEAEIDDIVSVKVANIAGLNNRFYF